MPLGSPAAGSLPPAGKQPLQYTGHEPPPGQLELQSSQEGGVGRFLHLGTLEGRLRRTTRVIIVEAVARGVGVHRHDARGEQAR